MNRQATKHGGFTLMELMVAIALTVVMVVAINEIFSSTQKAVGYGVGLSRVMEDGRAMAEQLRRDVAMMIGPQREVQEKPIGPWTPPTQGGMLIIVQREIEAPIPAATGGGIWQRNDKANQSENPEDLKNVGQRLIFPKVRSDQLVFIRARGDEEAIAPQGTNNFTSEELEGADFIRVWYGHVRRTSPVGDNNDNAGQADVVDPNSSNSAGMLGRKPEIKAKSGQRYVIDNELASDWILGRQALFLNRQQMNAGSSRFAEGAWFSANVNLPGVSGLPFEPAMYMGLTDAAQYGFDRAIVNAAGAEVEGCVVGAKEASAASAVNPAYRLWTDFTGGPDVLLYNAKALVFYTFARKQLRVMTDPAEAMKAPGNTDADPIESWRVAQTHPYFMSRVSDFEVEFAADLEPPFGEIDQVKSNQSYPNTDKDINKIDYVYPGGGIKWYGAYGGQNNYHANDPGDANPDQNYDSTKPIRFRADVGGSLNNNPTYIAGAPAQWPHADHAFVFRHDDDGVKDIPGYTLGAVNGRWPYLLRIRWRMHDPQNRLTDPQDGLPGMWFEVIVPVSRPR
ncbi:MAG: prepilin-type N-terminal cleavage/methylation domain-containing protein [Phycisphaeraceae bacterium]|nr:prepilin-type N-terminal cleavage/methylation domain-containing protein [Phycisphaeraceae bacterium]